MEIITKYRRKQLFILSFIFIICASVIYLVEYLNEKKLLTKSLNHELTIYSDLINNYLVSNNINEHNKIHHVDSLVHIIEDKNIRITLINLKGKVFYDNRIEEIEKMENHLSRAEVKTAITKQIGSDIRVSATDNHKYYYFAKKYNQYIIRTSIEYNIATSHLIEPKKYPIIFIVLIFFVSTIILFFVVDKFGKSVSLLKRFTLQAINDQTIDELIKFPKNELGNIGREIVDIYERLNKAKTDLLSEKEKLIRHLNLLDEGVAIFTSDKKIIANNSSFIQFISHISDHMILSPEDFFKIESFLPLIKSIDAQLVLSDLHNKQSRYEININKVSKVFSARSIVFPDKSIEIILSDITKPAKQKIIKQQLTENIAHELKTPVSSIKGFLETMIDKRPEEKKLYEFINKAYSQTCRLTQLINDISLLTKIEEAGNLYQIEKIDIAQIIRSVIDDLSLQLKESQLNLMVYIPQLMQSDGNPILMYSIFRNLIDNTLSHAGKNVTVKIEKIMEDDGYYYFSYSDTGIGAPEEDLPRLFERFYRVDKGRDHKKGGTGLGLAIVKNAVLFHKGEISVKNKKEGGLEFLFSFKKNLA
jgi:signal transduction histidine kinase